MVKTITMTNGEYEFDGFFRLVSGGDPEEDPSNDVAFPPVSYLLWIIFIILMPILLTNLLVPPPVSSFLFLSSLCMQSCILHAFYPCIYVGGFGCR